METECQAGDASNALGACLARSLRPLKTDFGKRNKEKPAVAHSTFLAGEYSKHQSMLPIMKIRDKLISHVKW